MADPSASKLRKSLRKIAVSGTMQRVRERSMTVSAKIVGLRKEFGNSVAADLSYRLREEIISCRLKPGEPLRLEPLRERFGASFTTLREACLALVADGLVVLESQRGFRVALVTIEDLHDVTNARTLIELDVLRQSIEKGDDEWEIELMTALQRLNKIEERLTGSPAEDVRWRTAHKDFHFALVSACGSPTLLAIRSALFDRSERYRSLSAAYRPIKRNKTDEHRALMLAAINRDQPLAAQLIENHIRGTTDNVIKYAQDVFLPQ
jgi:GntR family transcriptional regulator, carbon starvation induced regulator